MKDYMIHFTKNCDTAILDMLMENGATIKYIAKLRPSLVGISSDLSIEELSRLPFVESVREAGMGRLCG